MEPARKIFTFMQFRNFKICWKNYFNNNIIIIASSSCSYTELIKINDSSAFSQKWHS